MPFVSLSNLKMHYEHAGAGPAAVVLVHGNFASWRWWLSLIENPLTGHIIYAPEMRGYGDSERMEAALPRAELVVWEGTGHAPQLEQPERFHSLLTAFLKGDGIPDELRGKGRRPGLSWMAELWKRLKTRRP